MADYNGTVCAECFGHLKSNDPICPNCNFNNATLNNYVSNGLEPFTLLDSRYLLGRVLGAGGFGITYAAFDKYCNQRCAIKEYFPLHLATRNPMNGDVVPMKRPESYEQGLLQLEAEAGLLSKLQSCKSIVSVRHFFHSKGTAYMVMEFIDGRNLKAVAQRSGGKMPYPEAYNCLLRSALALSEVHRNNILHRDVSPENLMLMNDGSIKLIDFGASKSVFLQESDNNNPILLKLSYAPPEQYSKTGKQGPWTDVYSLACTFYRIATGALVPTASERSNGAPVPPAHTIANDIPLKVSLAVQQAMELDISKRYLTMDAFIAAFSDYSNTPTSDIDSPPTFNNIIGDKFNKIKSLFKKIDLGKMGFGPKQPTATLVVDGADVQTIPLADGIVATVGRNKTCNLVCMSDTRISREHCRLIYHADTQSITVIDDSVNGTMVSDGTWLRRGERTVLNSDAELQMASSNNIVRVVLK